MNEQQRYAYVMGQIAIFNAQVAGMVAENMQRQQLGQSMAYTEDAFDELINKSCIHHNAIIGELTGH